MPLPEISKDPRLLVLEEAPEDVPGPQVELIVLRGNDVWQQLQGRDWSLNDWRGFIGPKKLFGRPVFGMHNAREVAKDPRKRLPSVIDWQRVESWLNRKWPVPVPSRWVIETEEDVDELPDCINGPITIDCEWKPYPLLFGVGWTDSGVQILWDEATPQGKEAFKRWFRKVVGECTVIFHNAMADIPVLETHLGVGYKDYVKIEDTMLAHAILWSELPHSLEFLCSMYGRHAKLKHLAESNILLYNWGDVQETLHVWEALSHELLGDPLAERVYREQSLRILPINLERQRYGIRVNKPRVGPALVDYTDRVQAASRLVETYVGWPLNLASPEQVQNYAYRVLGLPIIRDKDTHNPTIGADALSVCRNMYAEFDPDEERENGITLPYILKRIRDDGAEPVLECRAVFAKAAQIVNHYLHPLITEKGEIIDRIEPRVLIHAQASGRHSTVEPPLAQLPADLRDIICPDPGQVWIGHDWDQIELRINAVLSSDEPSIDAFTRKWDIHTLNCCDIFEFEYPPEKKDPHTHPNNEAWRKEHKWGGKEDDRRVFAKRFVYRLDYGGAARNAGDIPGTRKLGLDPKTLVKASKAYLSAHPAKITARKAIKEEVLRCRVIRTFSGRPRRLLGDGGYILREACNHPMQAGVSDIYNQTLIAVKDAWPRAKWVYGMHDSMWWSVAKEDAEAFKKVYQPIVEREWEINGVKVSFPGTFKEVEAPCF